ncbi:MAG: hypothetical protein ABI693_27650, partial [Bryobacteraceae bacterium]
MTKTMCVCLRAVLSSVLAISLTGAAGAQTSSITVQGVLNGSPWQTAAGSPIAITLNGPQGTIKGQTLPLIMNNLPPGTYVVTYAGGGPVGSTFAGISPCIPAAPASSGCSITVAAGQSASTTLQFLGVAQPTAFSESFNNSPDFTNNWYVDAQYGDTSVTYTPGSLTMWASRSAPYPPGSNTTLASNLTFQGDIDVTFTFNHQGKGRTSVWLMTVPDTTGAVAMVNLDTDDTDYLNFAAGQYSTQWKYAGTPYMNRLVPIRIQVQGTLVNFYADGNLMETFPIPAPAGQFQLAVATGSVPWKSGDNTTTFTSIAATGAVVTPPPAFLSMPLKGTRPNIDQALTPASAPVNTVFDHSMINIATGRYQVYGCDYSVSAFAGELGSSLVGMPSAWHQGCARGYSAGPITNPLADRSELRYEIKGRLVQRGVDGGPDRPLQHRGALRVVRLDLQRASKERHGLARATELQRSIGGGLEGDSRLRCQRLRLIAGRRRAVRIHVVRGERAGEL